MTLKGFILMFLDLFKKSKYVKVILHAVKEN